MHGGELRLQKVASPNVSGSPPVTSDGRPVSEPLGERIAEINTKTAASPADPSALGHPQPHGIETPAMKAAKSRPPPPAPSIPNPSLIPDKYKGETTPLPKFKNPRNRGVWSMDGIKSDSRIEEIIAEMKSTAETINYTAGTSQSA